MIRYMDALKTAIFFKRYCIVEKLYKIHGNYMAITENNTFYKSPKEEIK